MQPSEEKKVEEKKDEKKEEKKEKGDDEKKEKKEEPKFELIANPARVLVGKRPCNLRGPGGGDLVI